ncbi:MAG TPA: hypothetical protein VN132_00800, partial [Bdellovibrio sp.]|nr:hypothetical protein [Bdellovibrio sp.]
GYIFHQFSIEGREQQSLLEKLQIAGLGPQIGYRFSVKRQKWHLHWRGFREFSRDSHIAGWDVWMALSIPL